jgi:hypothetical protein
VRRVPELHAGAERHVHEVRHVWKHDGVFVRPCKFNHLSCRAFLPGIFLNIKYLPNSTTRLFKRNKTYTVSFQDQIRITRTIPCHRIRIKSQTPVIEI